MKIPAHNPVNILHFVEGVMYMLVPLLRHEFISSKCVYQEKLTYLHNQHFSKEKWIFAFHQKRF